MLKKINKVLLELEKLDSHFFRKLASLSDFQLQVLLQLRKKSNKTLSIASFINLNGFEQSRTQRYRDIQNLIGQGFCRKINTNLVLRS
jgi:hypothetical protein